MEMETLESLTPAPGADSGKRGTITCIAYRDFQRDFGGDERAYYDGEKFLVSLQGLLNRDKPVLYVADKTGELWFPYFRHSEDGLLYGYARKEVHGAEEIIGAFIEEIRSFGLVVWDPLQPFTSNIASTVCGVEGYLPVMYSTDPASLYIKLTKTHGIAVRMDLRGRFTGRSGTKIWDTSVDSTGSTKCDAYLWALEKYLKTGKCSAEYIAYMRDAWPVNHDLSSPAYLGENIYETYLPDQDFLVMKKAFFVDLCPFPDDIPNDDPQQEPGLDHRTLCAILRQQYENAEGRFSQCVGFAPFLYKYTDRVGGKYDDVMAEFVVVEVMSAHNIAVQADCPGPSSIHNCSVYTLAKNDRIYSQAGKRPHTLPDFDPAKKYIALYLGDYDAASWTAVLGPDRWQDPARGKLPLAWAFNPNLYERIPQVFDWYHATATANDIFVAGDSGAGYVNPPLLEAGKRLHSDLPDGLEAWKAWCAAHYRKFDITMTPFILDGNTGDPSDAAMEAYAAFSPDGCGVWTFPGDYYGNRLFAGMSAVGMPNDYGLHPYGEVSAEAERLLNIVQTDLTDLPFYQIKTNITRPSFLMEALNIASARNPDIVLLDFYTFYGMVRRELEKREQA